MKTLAQSPISPFLLMLSVACAPVEQGISIEQRNAAELYYDAGSNFDASSGLDASFDPDRTMNLPDSASAADQNNQRDAAQPDRNMSDSALPDTNIGPDAAWPPVESDPPLTCDEISCGDHGHCAQGSGSGMPVPGDDEQIHCVCDEAYHAQDYTCVLDGDPCFEQNCSGFGQCIADGETASCECDQGYTPGVQMNCLDVRAVCGNVDCSGHGECIPHGTDAVCACDVGFSPGDALGLSCVPTAEVCPGGALPQAYDVDDDGTDDTTFYPTDDEKRMYELVNYTRATHDMEGAPECFRPLAYNLLWSAHGRNHSLKMKNQGGLFHDDFPFGQNCAYGMGPEGEIHMYMTGPSEPHCPTSSHHCNIMNCRYGSIGVGTVGTWNTQNFY